MLSHRAVRPVPVFAALGAVSGLVTVAILRLRPNWQISLPGGIDLWPLSVVPGLVFGFVIGLALMQRGRASPAAFVGYVCAATLGNFAAVTLATEILAERIASMWIIGVVAGLFGAACLTACTLALLPVARKPGPAGLMIVTGGALGALLAPAMASEGVLWWVVFYGLWHAGYAASLATALSRR